MRTFLLKAKHFFKRNIYPITVSICTVLILTIVTVSAYNSIRESENVVESDTTIEDVVVDTGAGDEKEDSSETIKPTVSADPIIFDLPFEKAEVTKQFADKSLLYDNTTKYWRTHQALDFACIEGTKVVAVYAGTVEKVENSMMYGTVVYLKISNELTVVYKGLTSNISVKEGDKLVKGAVIGTVTSFLAEKADGVHLHLELLKNGVLINPNEYFSFNK